MKYLYNPATDEFESLAPTLKDRFDLKDQVADASDAVKGTEEAIGLSLEAFKAYQNAGGTKSYKDFVKFGNEGVSKFFKDGGRVDFELGGGVIQGEKVGGRENFATPASKTFSKIDSLKNLILQYNNNPLMLIDKTGRAKGTNVISQMKVLQDAGFSQGFQSMSKTGPTRDLVRKELKKLLSYQDKMEAYMNNVVLDDNAPAVKFTNIRSHLGKKFGVGYDSMLLKNFLSNSKTYQENKRIFSALSQPLSKNKLLRAPDGTFRSMGDVAEKVLNKLPSSMGLFSTDVPERFILESAKRNFLQNKNLGQEAKITFITNPEVTPRTKWQFIHNDTGRLFSSEPYLDKIEFQGKKYKNNYLYVKNAAEKYPEFKGVYKMYNEDLPKYKAAKTADGKSLDQAIKMKNYEITKKENYKIRRGVDIDHKNILIDPFGEKPDSLRLVDARVNRQAGMLKNYYKGKELEKKLIDIGYINSDKNVKNFIDRTNKELSTIKNNSPKTKGLAKKGLKTALKQLPLVGSAIGLYDMGKAVQAGVRNPLDLYTAYEVSPEVALKSKAMREDKTGKLLAEEISKLPDIGQELPDSDEVAGLLEESGSPYMQFLQDGGQLSFEEFQKMQSIPQSERPVTGELNLPDMDQTMMAAQGGRVGFQDGSPDPRWGQFLSAFKNTDLIELLDKEKEPSLKEEIFGKEGERSAVQRLYETFNPKAFPYYAAKLTKGLTLAPEFAGRFTLAAPKALAELAQGKKGVGAEFAENVDPKVTQKQVVEKFGLQKIIDDMEENVTGSQKISGDLFKMIGESVGPATGLGYFASAGKVATKAVKEIKKYAGGAEAAKQLEKSIEEKAASLQMTRREFNSLLAGGGIIGLVKALGLDTLFPAAKQIAKQAAPEIVTKGGTPKYFFDFVSLIKSKGDDVSETASTVERQKVYDYKGYTLTEDISSGEIKIYKDTEGGGQYTTPDGELETYDGVMYKEEISYTPRETILNDKGKPVEVPDIYEESTLKPDMDGDLADAEGGLESIDEILDILSDGGKKYSLDELREMGINPAGLGKSELKRILKDPTEINRLKGDDMFKDSINKVKYRFEKAEGGIISGVKSGPPPKSGKTPHGLPYVAKNVRPIKERN